MAMSTFQKVTLATCLVLCVALLLPKMLLSRGRKDAAERPEGLGHFPPMMHRQKAPDRAAATGFSRAHNPEATARAKGAGTGAGAGTGGKSNLAGQIIPVYGFGILLYILYILFKITSKGNSKPPVSRLASVRSENKKRKITDFELAQLQEKLRETELVMENIVSDAHHSPDRVKGVTADQEASLLQQLMEITRVMQEGHLVEEAAPEKKNWEDYLEDPRPYWEESDHCCPHGQTEARGTPPGDPDSETVLHGAAEAEVPDRESGDGTVPENDACGTEPETGDLGAPEEEELTGAPEEEELTRDPEEEELTGAPEEEELSLTVTYMEEEAGSLRGPTEDFSSLRRRNRRRKAKKVSH